MDRERARLGFLLVTANLFVYALFMCLEVALAPEGVGRGDILAGGLWAAFMALAIGAAYLLKQQASAID